METRTERNRQRERKVDGREPKAKLERFQVRRYEVCVYVLYPGNCMAPKLLSSAAARKLLLG